MKKQFFLVVLLAVFSLVLAEQNASAQEGISTYSTVNYDAANNTVSGYSYTYATYANSGYYDTQVTSYIADSDDFVLDSGTYLGRLSASILMAATGTGCGEYRIVSSHSTVVQYYATAYFYNNDYRDGYYDLFDYLQFSEQGQSYPLSYSFFAPAVSTVSFLDYSEIILGSTENTSSGSCVIPQIEKVEFEQIGGPIDDHPAINGLTSSNKGKRIYPDKESSTDGTDRTKVRIKVTVTPAIQGVNIYFKSYDMDDPSSNSAPLDTTGSGGNDNKGAVNNKKEGEISASAATTNTSGVAYHDLTVTKNPGDNFAVVVSKKATDISNLVVDGVELKMTNQAVIPVYKALSPPPPTTMTNPAMRTELLTVWRRLHVEVDKMENVPARNASGANNTTGTVSQSVTIPSGSSFTDVAVANNPDLAETGTLHRFYNGRVIFGTNTALRVTRNGVTSGGTYYIQVQQTSQPITLTSGQSYILFDDDDYNSDDTIVDGDDGEAINPIANIFGSAYSNAFDGAYIKIERTWASQYDGSNVPFDLNLYTLNDSNGVTALNNVVNSKRGSSSFESNDFWVAYILLAYQSHKQEDYDGFTQCSGGCTTEAPLFGAVYSPTTNCDFYCPVGATNCSTPPTGVQTCSTIPRGGDGGVIFQEVIRDYQKDSQDRLSKTLTIDTTIVAHEIAHQFGIKGDKPGSTLFKIMDYPDYTQPTVFGPENKFHDEHLNILRSRVKSPGQQ